MCRKFPAKAQRRKRGARFTCLCVVAPLRETSSLPSVIRDAACIRDAPWSIDHVPWPRARVLPAIDNQLSVDEHVVDPDRIDKWLLIRGPILNLVVVENDDVGPAAFLDHAARIETHPRRGP